MTENQEILFEIIKEQGVIQTLLDIGDAMNDHLAFQQRKKNNHNLAGTTEFQAEKIKELAIEFFQ